MKSMPQKPTYTLDELIAQCDPDAPMPAELVEWEQAESVGAELILTDEYPGQS